MAFLQNTATRRQPPLPAKETTAATRDSTASLHVDAMAMGGGSADENGYAMSITTADSLASSSSSSSSSSSVRAGKEYLRRLGSRSLNEEHSRASTHSDESVTSVDASYQRNSLPGRVTPGQEASSMNSVARHTSDAHLNDRYYAGLRDSGHYIKMGWLTKQGHVWKNWKNRFFVLFHDGTLAYYKAKTKRRMKGCVKLNEGVVSIQYVDVRRSHKPYVIQVEKGFYKMWCHCISQSEAELWVNALRSVRQHRPLCFEPVLTLHGEQLGHRAVTAQLNKIFMTDERIQSMLSAFLSSIVPHTLRATYEFIERLEDSIMNKYVGFMYTDPNVPMLSGNEVLKFLRRHIEDRAFVPVAGHVYSNLHHGTAKAARSNISKSLKVLKLKPLHEFGVPEDIAAISSDWSSVRVIVDTIDCMSLPSHKIDMVIHAGSTIHKRVAERLGCDHELSYETLSALFRFVLVHSHIDDLAIVKALLEPIHPQHPACQNQADIVKAFVDAIAWLESYHQANDDANAMSDGVSLASARVTVSISTPDVGILFTNDGNGRGAVVYNVRKLSQAALSEVIVPGLSLIAINDEPVILMPLQDICQRLRTAALPKKLTFLPEFFYYQLLSLDHDMYQYLLCLAASRGDKDSVSWLVGSQLDVNEPCSWEKTRGAQVFGCKLPDVGAYPLHAATQNGHYEIVDYLLRLGGLPSQPDRRGRTPLHVIATGTLDIVVIIEALNNAGASLDAADREGVTPLMEFARRGSLEGVTTLLALGAELSVIAWSTGYTALEYAVSSGVVRVVELLLSKQADPNHATLDGDTSLHLAATLAHPGIVRLLIDAGARTDHVNRFSQTPAAVLLAQSAGDSESKRRCLTLLVNAGCEVHRPDLLGRFLVHLAQLANDDSVWDLLRHRFDSGREQAVDIFGCTAEDYDFDHRIGTELVHLPARDPRQLWWCPGSGGHHQPRTSAKSIDELIHRLLHDVSVDLPELVAFSMFLESIANVDTVMNHLREHVSNGSKSRNILQFVVVLLLFKLRHAKEHAHTVTELYALVDRHRRLMSHKTTVMVDEYKEMFQRLFSLRGSPKGSAEHYASIPIAIQHLYGPEQALRFTASFPRNLLIQVEPSQWAEHCTLVTHSLFCSIPVEDFVSAGSKAAHSHQFLSAKRWFQYLSAYVINAVLVEDHYEVRARVISFFLSAAEWCLSLRNYDTLAAILYALQSTAVQRLRKTMNSLPLESKKLLNQMQGLSDKGCREINKLMLAAANPSMPYIGLYLQRFVGLNELPAFEKGNLINGQRLRKLGELVVDILRRRSTAYELPFHQHVESILHVDLPFATDENRYARSLQLEPREAGAAPLGDRMTYVDTNDLDIDSEVRESIGSEGTFGIRQWFRMQKVVHRNRSRSSAQAASYEWV